MKTLSLAPLLVGLGLVGVGALGVACDEHKYDAMLAEAGASASAVAAPIPTPSATASTPPAPTWTRKNAADCKPHPQTIDFTDQPGLKKEVRRKLSKDTGSITPSDLAQIKSINLSTAKIATRSTRASSPCSRPSRAASWGPATTTI